MDVLNLIIKLLQLLGINLIDFIKINLFNIVCIIIGASIPIISIISYRKKIIEFATGNLKENFDTHLIKQFGDFEILIKQKLDEFEDNMEIQAKDIFLDGLKEIKQSIDIIKKDFLEKRTEKEVDIDSKLSILDKSLIDLEIKFKDLKITLGEYIRLLNELMLTYIKDR